MSSEMDYRLNVTLRFRTLMAGDCFVIVTYVGEQVFSSWAIGYHAWRNVTKTLTETDTSNLVNIQQDG